VSELGYSTRQVAELVGLTPGRILGLVRAGVLEPSRGPRGELRFAFEDVALLRSTRGLAQCPPRRLGAAVRGLARDYPDRSAAAFRLEVEGRRVLARDEHGTFEPCSGQALLPFDGEGQDAGVISVRRPDPAAAEGGFCRAAALEDTAEAEAAAAYERALALDPDHVRALVNLGRLRHLAGDAQAAVALYRRALRAEAAEPTAWFNLGVALEDLGDEAEALRCYETSVQHEPAAPEGSEGRTDRLFADAHYNAARLCEKMGDQLGAVRHLRRYRALRSSS
jgi:tetratricopeptide (TPR) repeat protein